MRPCGPPGFPCPRPLGVRCCVTSTARPWHLLVGDVEAEHHVMPLCMCLAPRLRNALETYCCWPGDGRGLPVDRRRRGVVRAAFAVPAAARRVPGSAAS